MLTKVRGSFTDVQGTGHFDVADPTGSMIDLRVGAASIDTSNPEA